MVDTVRTEDEALALGTAGIRRSFSFQDLRDVLTSMYHNAGSVYIKTGGQNFDALGFTEDNTLRFPIVQPYVYAFKLTAFFGAAGSANEVTMSIRTSVSANCRIDKVNTVVMDDVAEPANTAYDMSIGGISSTAVRSGYVDPIVAGDSEAIFIWKADVDTASVLQGSMLQVWRFRD